MSLFTSNSTPNPQQSSYVPEKRLIIREETPVSTVQKEGSTGQKLFAPLFDVDKDGKYNSDEAECFNSYRFKSSSESVVLWKGEKKTIFEINNLKNVTGYIKSNFFDQDSMKLVFTKDNGETFIYQGPATASPLEINLENSHVNIKNTKAQLVFLNGGSMNIENVDGYSYMGTSATHVYTDSPEKIKIDESSNVRIRESKNNK